MGIILTFIAYFLLALLAPLGIIWMLIRVTTWKKFNDYFYHIAFSIDQTGNVFCQYLFNDFLIKKGGYQFGNPDETVSYILGRNKALNALTWFGKFICWILDKIQKNHVENAAKNEQ